MIIYPTEIYKELDLLPGDEAYCADVGVVKIIDPPAVSFFKPKDFIHFTKNNGDGCCWPEGFLKHYRTTRFKTGDRVKLSQGYINNCPPGFITNDYRRIVKIAVFDYKDPSIEIYLVGITPIEITEAKEKVGRFIIDQFGVNTKSSYKDPYFELDKHRYEEENINLSFDISKYPHICPDCGGPAYIGFNDIDCSRCKR